MQNTLFYKILLKRLKLLGVLFGVAVIFVLALPPLEAIRSIQIFNERGIYIGQNIKFYGDITKIDTASLSYRIDFRYGERVCVKVEFESKEVLWVAIHKNRANFAEGCEE